MTTGNVRIPSHSPHRRLTNVQEQRSEALDRAATALCDGEGMVTHSIDEVISAAEWIFNGDAVQQVGEVLTEWRADLDSEPHPQPLRFKGGLQA